MTARDAAYFDEWYADLQVSAREAEIVQTTLGLPPELESTSLLPWDGISDVQSSLRLSPGAVLLDLACGRGGYGLEIARRTGARLVGVDFSGVAIERARENVARFGLGGRVDFVLGDLVRTGLEAASVDAVICIDAVQFADPPLAAIRECARVLRPGGRIVLTAWRTVDRTDERIPERLRDLDLTRDLLHEGFGQVEIAEKGAWDEAERALWEATAAVDAAGDPAIISLQEEAAEALAMFDLLRRISVTASAPARAGG